MPDSLPDCKPTHPLLPSLSTQWGNHAGSLAKDKDTSPIALPYSTTEVAVALPKLCWLFQLPSAVPFIVALFEDGHRTFPNKQQPQKTPPFGSVHRCSMTDTLWEPQAGYLEPIFLKSLNGMILPSFFLHTLRWGWCSTLPPNLFSCL